MLTLAEFASLVAAFLAAGFAAVQSQKAEEAERTAKRALRTSTVMAERQTRVNEELDRFKEHCTHPCSKLCNALMGLSQSLARKVSNGSFSPTSTLDEWDVLRHEIKGCRAAFRQFRLLLPSDRVQNVFAGTAYDDLTRAVSNLALAVEDREELQIAVASLDHPLERFIEGVYALLDSGRESILAKINSDALEAAVAEVGATSS